MKYFAAHPGTALHRDRLIDALWGDLDAERGRERRKVTMYFIRRRLKASGVLGDLVSTLDHGYMLRRESVWLAVIMHRMWADGTKFEWTRGARPEVATA